MHAKHFSQSLAHSEASVNTMLQGVDLITHQGLRQSRQLDSPVQWSVGQKRGVCSLDSQVALKCLQQDPAFSEARSPLHKPLLALKPGQGWVVASASS